MTPQNPKLRRAALQGSRLAALVSACMLVFSGYLAIWGQATASAATNNGGVVMAPTSGTAADNWDLSFAGSAIACPGDSATGQYRVQSFAVPAGTNLDTLTFTSTGPAVGQPLFSPAGDALVNGLTDITTGNILQLPGSFSFVNNGATDFAAGDWTVGIACTQGTGAGMTKSYWTTSITISNVVTTGAAADFSWAVGTPTSTTSSSTSTSIDRNSTTTTADPGTTTTTGDPGTTTTTAGGTTTTTGGASVGGSGTGGTPSAASPVTTLGQLPYTGNSPLPMVFWAVALLVFGRIAMLLGKRPKVIGDGPTG